MTGIQMSNQQRLETKIEYSYVCTLPETGACMKVKKKKKTIQMNDKKKKKKPYRRR